MSGGALTTPAYEYSRQAVVMVMIGDRRDNYVDMFKLYLNKVLVIKDYVASKEPGAAEAR